MQFAGKTIRDKNESGLVSGSLTRVDREFCKGRGCKQKYYYRKKAGWPGYN